VSPLVQLQNILKTESVQLVRPISPIVTPATLHLAMDALIINSLPAIKNLVLFPAELPNITRLVFAQIAELISPIVISAIPPLAKDAETEKLYLKTENPV